MPSLLPRHLARNGWTGWHLLSALLMSGLGLVLTWNAWSHVWSAAMHEQMLIPVLLVPWVAAWLVWVRRRRVRFCEPVGTWLGPILIATGWLVYSGGAGLGRHVVIGLGALLIVLGCMISVLGTDVARRFFPALAVLVFLVPVPAPVAEELVGPLPYAVAATTQQVYAWVGMELPGVEPMLLTSTSVLSVILVFVLLGYAVAFGMPLRWPVQVLILAMSGLFAVASLFARSLAIGWLYAWYSPEQVQQVLFYSAWTMVGAAGVCLLILVRMLRWSSIPLRRYTLAYDS